MIAPKITRKMQSGSGDCGSNQKRFQRLGKFLIAKIDRVGRVLIAAIKLNKKELQPIEIVLISEPKRAGILIFVLNAVIIVALAADMYDICLCLH